MKNRTPSGRCIALASVLALALALGVCSVVAAQADSAAAPLSPEKIGLMPFFKGSFGSSITETLICPVCDLTFDPEHLTPDCDKVLTRYVQEALEKKHGPRVVPQPIVVQTYARLRLDERRDTPLGLSQKVGRLLGANLMTVGSVWRYRERRGGTRAVESPASVAFALHVVEVESGRILWSRGFVETQRSLSENILDAKAFFERGAKWLTADELASQGVEQLFREFPY